MAEARLKLAQARLSKMRIVAPFDGVVGIRSVSLGDYVKDGTDLVNVEDVRVLKVDFRLPERNFAQIHVGQSVEVVADALPGERFAAARSRRSTRRVDANGRSLEIRARLDNTGGKLRPGMFVRVRVIVGERQNALLVPEESIVPQGEEFFVYKVVDGAGAPRAGEDRRAARCDGRGRAGPGAGRPGRHCRHAARPRRPARARVGAGAGRAGGEARPRPRRQAPKRDQPPPLRAEVRRRRGRHQQPSQTDR